MYFVTKRFGRAESRLDEFVKEKEAVAFILTQLADDKRLFVSATYGLYEGADLLKEYSQADLPVAATTASDASNASGAGQSSSQSFAPTPFNTTPRLGPQTWIKDDVKKDEDDDK